MSKLERYLELNWPDIVGEMSPTITQGEVGDHAIAVMRDLDHRLGGKDAELARVTTERDALVEALRYLVDESTGIVEQFDGFSAIDAKLIPALSAANTTLSEVTEAENA